VLHLLFFQQSLEASLRPQMCTKMQVTGQETIK
jgi:hypothetical protein